MELEIKNTNDISPTKLNLLLIAPPGYGKTTAAKTLPGKTLVVDAESGLLPLRGAGVDYVSIEGKTELEKFKNFRSLLGLIAASDYDNIFLDSITEIASYFLAEAESVYPEAKNTQQRFGHFKKTFQSFLKYTRDLDKNIIYSALDKVEKDEVGTRYHYPNIVGSLAQEASALFDFVFHIIIVKDSEGNEKRALLTKATDGYKCKDRSDKLSKLEPVDLAHIIKKAFN